MPVVASQRPNTLARCTSNAAIYAQAPPRSYSCSTRIDFPGSVGRLGCMRSRAWILVFSSAEMTNSSLRSDCPCQRRSYRSRMRPALAWKCGSRGKIQQRCCQGRIAPLVQPTPDRAVADARHQARALRVSRHVRNAQARQRQAQGGRQLAGERLDLNRELWGERPEGVPGRALSSRPANRSLKKRWRH